MGKLIDITGKKFGRLTAIGQSGKDKSNNHIWECICNCGKTTFVRKNHLVKNATKSCGCLNSETARNRFTKHGLHNSTIHRIWVQIIGRCYNENNKSFKNYGGRGISVCSEWKKDFQTFYDWSMANGYKKGLTIERIDNNGNYEPSNCCWDTMKKQGNNRRNNKMIEYKGEIKSLAEWCEILNLSYQSVWQRINNLKWSIEDSFERKK